jgi:hypothetical protein
MTTAPPGQIIALRFDNNVGKAVSGDVALLLLFLANAFARIAEDDCFSKSESE